MTDIEAPRPSKRNGLVVWVALALVGAALAIAAWLWLGNAAGARECPVQSEAAAAIADAAVGELAALQGTGEGRGYATLAFTDADGTPKTIGDWKGKGLLVNFWASWCVPCREEMPALDALAAKYNGDQFEVLPINLDVGGGGREKAEAFLADGQFGNLPLYADNSFAAFDRLKREAVAVGLPATLVLDQNGCELAVLQGPAEWNTPDGEAVVRKLLELI